MIEERTARLITRLFRRDFEVMPIFYSCDDVAEVLFKYYNVNIIVKESNVWISYGCDKVKMYKRGIEYAIRKTVKKLLLR